MEPQESIQAYLSNPKCDSPACRPGDETKTTQWQLSGLSDLVYQQALF